MFFCCFLGKANHTKIAQDSRNSYPLSVGCRDQSFTTTHRFKRNDKGLPEVTAASTAIPTRAPE